MSQESELFIKAVETQTVTTPLSRQPTVVTDTARALEIIHISLSGMAAIALLLLCALSLPVMGQVALNKLNNFLIAATAAFTGVSYLYYLNYQTHKQVTDSSRLTEVLINSVGQGFLAFGANGICETAYSQACLDLLETVPAGKHIMDVLRVPVEARSDFQDWLDVLFMPNHALGFQDVVNFFPQHFAHSGNRRISLTYRPIYQKADILTRIVLIATDQTEEYAAQGLAAQRQEYADMICRIFRERNQFLATIAHVRRFIEEAALPVRREESAGLLRLLHTLKAAVKHFHFTQLGETVHLLETQLRNPEITSDAMFMDVLTLGRRRIERELADMLETVKDLVGRDFDRRGNTHEVEESQLYSFALLMSVSGIGHEVIDHFLRFIVAVPVQDCFRQFERELMDLAEFTGKQIKATRYTGSNPPVLTRTLHALIFSLTHIARNIIDHGIEANVVRLAHGKDPMGQITIHADIEMDADRVRQWLYIAISDDGGGIDPSRVRAKLSLSDPDGAWRGQDDHEIIQNIFFWGFSTRDTVSDLSGRGVGMEVVEREVKALGGKIEVFSTLFQGTRFDIRVPYTLQI